MSEVARIEDQLKRSFDGGAWHGPSVREILQGLTAEKAAARPIPGAHNIWEIAIHIGVWETAALRRLKGESFEPTPEEDWPPVIDTSQAAWQVSLDALWRGHAELLAAVSQLDDSQLEKTVPGRPHSVYFTLHGAIQHNLYHAGQMAILKKALG